MAHDKKHPRTILDLHPGQLKELDGAVLDLDSYHKHCTPTAHPGSAAGACDTASSDVSPDTSATDEAARQCGSFFGSARHFSGSASGSSFAGGYGLELI